jgi:hypothetical protein
VVGDPSSAIRFGRNIQIHSKLHHLLLDLRGVKSLTIDGIGFMLAVIGDDEIRKTTSIIGNEPEDADARRLLIESGFYSHVETAHPVAKARAGIMAQRSSRKVEPLTAQRLIHVATEALYGCKRRCRPAYRVLIECMNNTHNHAAGDHDNRETWWAFVHADAARQRQCYAFLDTGVGIFESVRVGKLRKLFRTLGIEDNSNILRDILMGKVESRTGQPFRGKGLPSIHELSRQHLIHKLTIVSNDVYANVDEDEFRTMDAQFRGTLLYWEV